MYGMLRRWLAAALNERRRAWAAELGLAVLALAVAACAAGSRVEARMPKLSGEPLLIAVAANVEPALREIAAQYGAQTGERMTLTVGSTGQLVQQIEHGAPVDLFFAADERSIELLAAKGLALPESRRTYAIGRLALVASPHAAVRLHALQDLADPAIRVVAMANPEHAPYGLAARQTLERSGLWTAVQPKGVFGENIQQALQYVVTGNADAGFVAYSLIAQRTDLAALSVEPTLYDPLRQAAAVVAASRQRSAAETFLKYAVGPDGREILARYGFQVPGDAR